MTRQWETLKEYKEIKYEFLKVLQRLRLIVLKEEMPSHQILYKK